MLLGPNPLMNGLIQHTFKSDILFLEYSHKYILTRQNFFLLITSHHNVLEFFFWENKKIRVRFLIGDPLRQARQAKKK